MSMRSVKVLVTTEEGELLDSITIELNEKHKAIAVKAIDTEIPRSGLEEALTIGLTAGYN